MNPIGRLGWIQVDCVDPERLAAFWSQVLGLEIDSALGSPPRYVGLIPSAPGEPVVSFQRVPEIKETKNRLHFDIAVEDPDSATSRIEDLGGQRLSLEDFGEYGFRWRVMADPEGNEFCLIY
jgi:predicted enzyme related to lactoylglutathione lyase